MSLRTNNNIFALNVQRAISRNTASTNHQVETLSSGLRVKRAASDAAGLSISEGMRAKLAGLGQNLRNTEQASDLLQVAEGSLQEASKILVHMRELSVRAADGGITDEQREVIAADFNQARQTLDQIAQNTTYNNTSLLAGSNQVVEKESTAVSQSGDTGVDRVQVSGAVAGTYTFADAEDNSTLILGNGQVTQTLNLGTILDQGKVEKGSKIIANFDRLGLQVTLSGEGTDSEGDYMAGDLDGAVLTLEEATGAVFQVGPDAQDADRIEFDVTDLRTSSNFLNLNKVSMSSQGSAREAFASVDLAIARMADERGRIGALQNRLAHSLSFSEIEVENMQDSDSAIRDADVARESTRFSRSQILRQSSSAMLVKAFDTTRLSLQLL